MDKARRKALFASLRAFARENPALSFAFRELPEEGLEPDALLRDTLEQMAGNVATASLLRAMVAALPDVTLEEATEVITRNIERQKAVEDRCQALLDWTERTLPTDSDTHEAMLGAAIAVAKTLGHTRDTLLVRIGEMFDRVTPRLPSEVKLEVSLGAPPPGYTECAEGLDRAARAWLAEHPDAKIEFANEPPDGILIVTGLDIAARLFAGNADTAQLLEHMDAATGKQATYLQARMVLDEVLKR